MNIRSVTAFTNLTLNEPELALAQAANFLHSTFSAFEAAGFQVQTRRVATQPYPHILAPTGPGLAVAFARRVQDLARDYGIDYVGLGPACVDDDPGFVDAIPEMIAATETVFCSVNIGDPTRGIDGGLIRRTAEVIRRLSTVTENGFSNLYLSAIANCPPGAPFFPVAYHETDAPMRFALALQAADLAQIAFAEAESVDDARLRLTQLVTGVASELSAVAERLAEDFDIQFAGLDISLAPFPDEAHSLGGAMERLGVHLGGSGAAAAAAVIMSALDAAQYPRVGFNGLMLPVLEDSVLAARAGSGALTLTDLLLYSTICGTGLDTVPLPGDISTESLAGILLDVAALALRLDKPLTARLMPIPGKAAGDDCGLESFEYFAPGRVMAAPPGLVSGGLLARTEPFRIRARGHRLTEG